jgi:hypothetical protein
MLSAISIHNVSFALDFDADVDVDASAMSVPIFLQSGFSCDGIGAVLAIESYEALSAKPPFSSNCSA